MEVRELPSTATVLNRRARVPMAVCLGAVLGVPAGAAASPAAMVVAPAQQAARDDERLRILRDELRRTEALAAQLAQRHAERLAAGDAAGADDAQAQRVRALGDIAGLEREITGLRPSSVGLKPFPSAAPSRSAGAPRPVHRSPPAPWWDVYRARRGEATDSLSHARPPGAAAGSTDRME